MAKKKEELKLEEIKKEKKNSSKPKKDTKNKKEEKVSVSTNKKNTTTTKKSTTKTEKNTSVKSLKESTKATSKTKNTKTTNSKATIKKNDVKPKVATSKKSIDTKPNSSKKIDSSKNKEITEKNDKVTPNTQKVKVKEETIIEKIKNFIAKIIAMQEEARNEELAKKDKKKSAKKAGKEENTIDLEKPVYLTEYYDLPYRYNETVVKILAQTPKRIFVYWDIADEDRIRYEKAFGSDFYEKTYPVLLVHNDDKDYTTEIPINDFANSWYIDINDPKTKYTIQLGRKFKEVPKNIDIIKVQEQNIILRTDYLPIAQSNILEVPNDHILFENMPQTIKYRNVKTYEEKEKEVSHIQTPYGILYDIQEFYQNNYKDEIDDTIFDLNNPTSGALSSSSFK